MIQGTDLTGATSVAFNGTAAVFKVVSASSIVLAQREMENRRSPLV